jgi:hypothetical protein
MIEEFARLLFKQVKLADEELAVALLFASIAYLFGGFLFLSRGNEFRDGSLLGSRVWIFFVEITEEPPVLSEIGVAANQGNGSCQGVGWRSRATSAK